MTPRKIVRFLSVNITIAPNQAIPLYVQFKAPSAVTDNMAAWKNGWALIESGELPGIAS